VVRVYGSYDKLRQLLLIEEFKNCLSSEVRTYIDKKKAETLNQAAVLANDYTLTHKTAFRQSSPQVQPTSNTDMSNSNPHQMNSCKGYQRYNSFSSGNGRVGTFPQGPEFHYCKKRGHVMAECWLLRNNSQGHQEQTFKSDMLVTQAKPPSTYSVAQEQPVGCSRNVDEYTPFISEDYISIPVSTTRVPITVLRDTCANQSLLIENKLPCAAQTSTGCDVLIQGVELEKMSIPLH